MGLFSFGPSKKDLKRQLLELQNKNDDLERINSDLKFKQIDLESEVTNLKTQLNYITLSKEETAYLDLKSEIEKLGSNKQFLENVLIDKNNDLEKLVLNINDTKDNLNELESKVEKELSNLGNISKKKKKINLAFKSAEYALQEYANNSIFYQDGLNLSTDDYALINDLDPSILLKIHSMDVKELKKSFNLVQESIEDTLEKYQGRYTTKANIAIYKLMVIALKAELQNILYNLKYGTLDESLNLIKKTTKKYFIIAGEGNQSIASTLSKFIGEIEYLFLNCVNIEYQYYVKKEQQRAEQAALREQMKQEAAEKKELEAQRKKVEAEEEKYKNEILKLEEQLKQSPQSDKEQQLELRIKELQDQLNLVETKKEEIVSRQNGKAGNVYVISNLGSFGKDVFKIGMTRRLDPFERIKELGSASVPFTFDVHSFIFSDDAVGLEQKLHSILDDRRVNKINLRKEFFNVSIDELEELIYEIDPSAEFNKTMLAEEYNQSLSLSI
ncbi:GIY-YIG nuclease family protein [Romboutsia lituseburensis]|uniref:GIY-YIG nuclease family protein n=1 Tax=Romboutsia lituseburensis TaxID=1537 RepID=UPI00215B080A|nr:GIY-YIG nuclease family protein [Romboutsia lituseburensis]MCR8744375.1 GIY-YIG nuclease family protein [Romboutsia lituseburensis]